ncbi:MAG: hypothetical protein KGJ13_09565 [Patescibacteria group bacterium]|nr:hypothetical protein [Patescibacteria group bacterium]
MNALEMAAKAMIEKALANLPPEVMGTIGQIGQIAVGIKAQLDRIENQNRLIMAALEIPADMQPYGETKGIENVRSE